MPTDLRLEIPTDDHADDWFQLFDDPQVMRFIGDGQVRDREWYRNFVHEQQDYARETGLCLFSVLVEGDVIGFVGVQPWTNVWGPTGRPELGWRLGKDYWGSGYATRAGEMALARAAANGIPQVVSLIQSGNTRSLSTALRLGMEFEREWTSPAGQTVQQFHRPTEVRP